MVVDLPGLRKNSDATRRYHFEEEFSPLLVTGEKLPFLAPVVVDVVIEPTGMVFLLRGLINTRIYRACGRCLKMVDQSVEVKFELAYVHRNDLEEIGIQSEPGEDPEGYEVFEDKPVDMRDIVLENLLMSIPMSFVCQAECRGWCPQCGKDLNQEECECRPDSIDPRLAVLQELLKTKQ
jgi:uncharacterized protein